MPALNSRNVGGMTLVLLVLLLLQQRYFILWASPITYRVDRTEIEIYLLNSWPWTVGLGLLLVVTLWVKRLPRNARIATLGIGLCGCVVYFIVLFNACDAGSKGDSFFGIRHNGDRIRFPTKAWQESAFLTRLYLDYSFSLAAIVGILAVVTIVFALIENWKMCPLPGFPVQTNNR